MERNFTKIIRQRFDNIIKYIMKHIHTKKITIELYYTDKEFDYLIDTIIKVNNKYHSNYHIKDTKEIHNLIKNIK